MLTTGSQLWGAQPRGGAACGVHVMTINLHVPLVFPGSRAPQPLMKFAVDVARQGRTLFATYLVFPCFTSHRCNTWALFFDFAVS